MDQPKLANRLGPIARTYAELQGLENLHSAGLRHPLPAASLDSTLRAVFQAAEVALLNLADLTERARQDLAAGAAGAPGAVDAAAHKLFWSGGFHRLLLAISRMPLRLALLPKGSGGVRRVSLLESPAFRGYLQALVLFDQGLFEFLAREGRSLHEVIGDGKPGEPLSVLVHQARVAAHDGTVWERNLTEIGLPLGDTPYEEWIVADAMAAMACQPALHGDTFFMQFRGLHQVPEILAGEVNDRLEAAILDLRGNRLPSSLEHLQTANLLSDGILQSLFPLVDSLTTAEYHKIRENLGLTSGSHSVALHHHLFEDLYQQLCAAVEERIDPRSGGAGVYQAVERIAAERFRDGESWLLYCLCGELLELSGFIEAWKDGHLHLPRNQLGSDRTRSLVGAQDALHTVQQMRDASRRHDPARGMIAPPRPGPDEALPLASYLNGSGSLSAGILRATGEVTRGRFTDVQERKGIFATGCPYTAPPPRKV